MILRLLQCRLIGLTSPYPLVPPLFLFPCLLYLVPGFSGRRLVQDCQCLSALLFHCARFPFGLAQPPFAFDFFTEGVTTLPPPFIDLSFFSLSCLLVCWVRLSFRVIGLCSFVSLAFFCSACFLLSLSLSLLALSLSYVTLGCCAWSFWPQTGPDFQRHPHFPLSFLPLPFPGEAFSFFVIQHCSSVVLLAADWSGVSLRWFLIILPTQHCLWPQTGPGAVAL